MRGESVRPAEAAADFQCSKRTIFRDFAFLRDTIGLETVYRKRDGRISALDCTAFHLAPGLIEKDQRLAAALALAAAPLRVFDGVQHGATLAQEEILQSLDDEERRDFDHLFERAATLRPHIRSPANFAEHIASRLAAAVASCEWVEVVHIRETGNHRLQLQVRALRRNSRDMVVVDAVTHLARAECKIPLSEILSVESAETNRDGVTSHAMNGPHLSRHEPLVPGDKR